MVFDLADVIAIAPSFSVLHHGTVAIFQLFTEDAVCAGGTYERSPAIGDSRASVVLVLIRGSQPVVEECEVVTFGTTVALNTARGFACQFF